MYLDHAKEARKREARESYDALKKVLGSKDKKQKLNAFFPALSHIEDMETEIAEKEVKIKEYRDFFAMLDKLLPRRSSIHDRIG